MSVYQCLNSILWPKHHLAFLNLTAVLGKLSFQKYTLFVWIVNVIRCFSRNKLHIEKKLTVYLLLPCLFFINNCSGKIYAINICNGGRMNLSCLVDIVGRIEHYNLVRIHACLCSRLLESLPPHWQSKVLWFVAICIVNIHYTYMNEQWCMLVMNVSF